MPATTLIAHRCPVCGTEHEVSRARAEMACGRSLACSPDCEAERRRRTASPWRYEQRRTGDVSIVSVAVCAGILLLTLLNVWLGPR